MLAAYGLVALCALAVVVACLMVDRKHDIHLLLMVASVFVCDLGYFLLAASPSLSMALACNRLVYLGQVALPPLLLLMILNLCRTRYCTRLPLWLGLPGLAVYLVVASPGILPWYYSSVSIETRNGVTQLLRTYGPLHKLYYIYLFGYLAADTAVFFRLVQQKKLRSAKHAVLLLAAVYSHVIIWLAEQFLPRGFEFLSVSYVMTELFILLVYAMLQDYGLLAADAAPATATASPAPVENGSLFSFAPEQIDHILANCGELAALTPRETEVLRYILADRRRKEIAEELYLSESSIKKYTASIFRKLAVESRKELLTKLGEYV